MGTKTLGNWTSSHSYYIVAKDLSHFVYALRLKDAEFKVNRLIW
jgi:hypothetical protein